MNQKEYLLLIPQYLRSLEPPFQVQIIEKKNGKYLAENISLEKYRTYPFLSDFYTSSIRRQKSTFMLHHEQLKPNKPKEIYVQEKLLQHYYNSFKSCLEELLTQENLRISIHKKNTPIKASNQKLKLGFKFSKNQKKIIIQAFYILSDQWIALNENSRFNFLVHHESEFFLLTLEETKLLNELEKDLEELKYNDLVDKYFLMLQKKYPVIEEGIFEEEVVKTQPETEIYVSEIGGDFLMFIPRWKYDDHLIDNAKKEDVYRYQGLKKIKIDRDFEQEKEVIEFLQGVHPNFAHKTENFYLKFSEASKNHWFFNFYYKELKNRYPVIGMDFLSYFKYSNHPIETTFKLIKETEGVLTISLKIHFGKEEISLKKIKKALLEKQKFVLLKDQSLGILTDDWLKAYEYLIKYSTLEYDYLLVPNWLYQQNETLQNTHQEIKHFLSNDWQEKWEKWRSDKHENLFETGENYQAELRPYQQTGFEWLTLMGEGGLGTLLADEMGLGKTVQTLASMDFSLNKNPRGKVLVVSPASLIYNWAEEIKKFTPHLAYYIYHGIKRDWEDFLSSEKPIALTSYSIIRNDLNKIASMPWEMIILDESHHIKNSQAQQTQAVLNLRAKKRILLNGTPIMNDVSDLYPQLKFMLPGFPYSDKEFKKQMNQKDEKENLKKWLNTFILRRTKSLISDELPEKTEMILWCDMDEDQQAIYKELKQKIRKSVFLEIENQGLGKAQLGVLQGINKLRQVCSHPHTAKDFIENQELVENASSIKIQYLLDELNSNLKNEKLLIFTQYLLTMEKMKDAFENEGISFLSFDGSTPAAERMEKIKAFQEEDSTYQVFIVSLMAGNSGINLTKANYVFLMEPWWNTAVQDQAINRVHRIGQKQKVFAYQMICKNTIEEKIMTIQNRKKEISEDLIPNDESFLKSLSLEDIQYLFE